MHPSSGATIPPFPEDIMPPNHSSSAEGFIPLPDGPALRLRVSLQRPSRMPAALALALAMLAGAPGYGGDILRGGAPAGKSGRGASSQNPINAAAERAKLNAKDSLARSTRAVLSVKAMQDAARAAAQKGGNNLGKNPNRPGQTLPNVPDGLARGGLQVAPGVPKNLNVPQAGEDASLWRGALLPKQTTKDGRKIVTIDQLKPQAVLNWQTFNIGKKTTLKFNQNRGGADKSQWTAFNKINDPSGAPSQILGKIEAPGQVYVVNANGILFGGSSQINLHGLVASSLPINDGLVARGLLSNPDSQFLFSALPIPAGVKGTPAFTPAPSNAPGGKYGDVVVQAGAKITSPTTGANVGGRVMLVGPNVKNEGTIETPDGQTVLAAGLQVGIAAHPSSDARLRGLDVYVGTVSVPPPADAEAPPVIPAQRPAGTATNTGLIDAPRANVTIAGKSVNQFGAINSSTSVTLNGSIHLLANFGAQTITPLAGNPFFSFTDTGTIRLGVESVMLILPELLSEKKVAGTELSLRSRVVIQGRNIHFGSNSSLLAPNADVELNAGRWLPDGTSRVFTYSTGQVYLDAGALINVAGTTDVSVSIAQNILSLELRGAELADSPLQRGGPLRGPTLNLDIRQRGVFNGREWVGTPLGDASGYVNLIERGVGELTTAGGTVTINAGGSVVMQAGSKVDVSGGYINFEGGMVKTTRVMSDGRIVDIANATPDREFTGLYDGTFTSVHQKFGIVRKWANPLALSGEYFDPGYVEGRNGGSVSITAPSMALDGELIGQTVEGPRQRTAALAPKVSSLSLTFEGQDPEVLRYQRHAPTPPAITFRSGVLAAAGPFQINAAGDAPSLRAERLSQVFLSPDLFTKFGFGSITINNPDGEVLIPAETELEIRPRGSLAIAAANLDVQGNIVAPGGTLSFTVYNFTPYHDHAFPPDPGIVKVTPPPDPARGRFTLGANATLSTAGLIVDDRAISTESLLRPLAIDGGSVSIAAYSVALGQGSVLDASGGVSFARDGRRSFGAGGAISVKAGNDPKAPQIIGGTLELGGTLQAFSGAKGGSLTIQAPSVQIGGATVSSPNTFHVQTEFFQQGGFASYTLIGLGEPIAGRPNEYIPAVMVAPNTRVNPVAESWTALSYSADFGGPQLVSILQPEGIRSPASLTLSAPGVRDSFSPDNAVVTRGDIVLSEGATIITDGRGAIGLSGETVTVLGSLIAPGGSIAVSGSGNPSLAFGQSAGSNLTSVHLGPDSVLSAAGKVIYTPTPFNQRAGVVLPGGRISVSGNIVAEAGAVLDVSGASGILNLAPSVVEPGTDVAGIVPVNSGVNSPLYSRATVPTRVESDAGEIVLAGGQHLFSDATLLGSAGGPSALGGSLIISSGRFRAPEDSMATPLDPTLLVTQSGATIPGPLEKVNGSAAGTSVRAADGSAVQGMGYFAADTFTKGGFDSLTLRGTVQFAGNVSIDARRTLSVADGGVLFADGNVTLSAPYVVLGTAFRPPFLPEQAAGVYPYTSGGQPFHFEPSYGPGNLTVIADLIDIGNLSLQNIGNAQFIAERGDIRGDGTFQMAGSLLLRAAQIYPPTAVTFNVAAYDYTVGEESRQGSITIESSGFRQLPWSAGGQLNIYASNIHQAGTLRAPLGGINLGWNGEGEAPKNPITDKAYPIASSVVLAPGSLTSVSAVPPEGGAPLVIPYGLNLNGVTWIDPHGRDITAGGVSQKNVNIAGLNVNSMSGSTVDIRGGGDLMAYRWVQGVGGTKDILASATSFAVVPGYGANYSPYAPFNPAPLAPGLNGDPGYANSTLKVGDRVHLRGGAGLPEGEYTLLPARYALMPGAFLVTQKSGAPLGSLSLPDGSTLVPGYRYNGLNRERSLNPQYSWFEVLSQDAVLDRADYGTYFANEFLFVGARANESLVPRLPADAGHLTLQANNTMVLRGTVAAEAPSKRRGGLVDIASPTDILINATGGTVAGKLVLDARQLSSFGAESLLIGGIRSQNGLVSNVAVKTGNLTVDNAGSPLSGPEIILVAKEGLTLANGASIIQEGQIRGRADTLRLGVAGVAGSGNGTLLRVTSDPAASIIRSELTNSTAPTITIGSGVNISGTSVTLDSTFGTSLDPTARINGDFINLNSGQISLQLDGAGTINSLGLILAGDALRSLESSKSLSLLSYSSIDLYGTGELTFAGRLGLHAAQIRGFDQGNGTVEISASALRLDNSPNAAVLPGSGPAMGALAFNAGTLTIGANQLALERYATVELNASRGIVGSGAGGISSQQDLVANAPVLTAQRSATQSIRAVGALTLNASGAIGVSGGLGASLTLQGTTVSATSDIVLPSGALTVRATNGDVMIGGRVVLTGTAQTFYDQVRYTSGGEARFISDTGSVVFAPDTIIDVSANAGGGDAGRLSISAANGSFGNAGTILGTAGAAGLGGEFALDTGSLGSFGGIQSVLEAGGFNRSQNIRVRAGDVLVDGTVRARDFRLSADQGRITVSATGLIDASGQTGGSISLAAAGSVILESGARLTVAAEEFNSAGKGGAIFLETRGTNGGVVDIRTGSTVDLGVAANTATSAAYGNFAGRLHLRAPQNGAGTDLGIATIGGNINGASVIIAEGFRVFDLTPGGGNISTLAEITLNVQNQARSNGNTFMGAGHDAMLGRLTGGNAALGSILSLRPGAEIINSTGGLRLGSTSSNYSNDWNLSGFRFGPRNAPGVLTIRAAGDIRLFNTISDGFESAAWNSLLSSYNPNLPANAQSWDFRFTAGADFAAADFTQARPIGAATTGSLILGRDLGSIQVNPNQSGATPPTEVAIATGAYQVIRTGSGNITINASRDVQFRNEFASIYTVGTQVANASVLPNGGTFDVPLPTISPTSDLGPNQRLDTIPAQYSLGGGDITISAGNDIARVRLQGANLLASSSKQMPTNWLYRRGLLDPVTGDFAVGQVAGSVDSTTWWVDYANFFEGVGTLGGGNIAISAARDVANVDAVAPTNARMAKGLPDAAALVELGGGDVSIRAGRDINAGVYYVERGKGTLQAGRSIVTNSTRTMELGTLVNLTSPKVGAAETWLPTTLFLGKSSFDVSARGDLLLGPAANPFLLPAGFNNSVRYKTYFSTYSADSAVNISSLSGSVTLRLATAPNDAAIESAVPILSQWYTRHMRYGRFPSFSSGNYQPWLLLNETNPAVFQTALSLMPATLRVNAFAGDVNVVGRLTLTPSANGTAELLAAGSINGLNPNGAVVIGGVTTKVWGTSSINISDADPSAIPSVGAPLGFLSTIPTGSSPLLTGATFLSTFDSLFAESGSTRSVLQAKQALHAPGLLHSADEQPVRIYAGKGDISGVTIFSPKETRIIAGRDIADVAFYLQNLNEDDVSVVAAGRDIVAYNSNTQRRVAAVAPGNALETSALPLAGDLQIAGPGTLEVLAGRDLDLGSGAINGDGTGAGIVSIGNARNPYLPFAGADLVIGAGVGLSTGLIGSDLDFTTFISNFVEGPAGERYKAELAEILGAAGTSSDLGGLDEEQKRLAALNIFYLMLRDAGRDHNDPASPGFENYDGGFAAIEALFPGAEWKGEISMTSRQVKTQSGGNISMFAPGGRIVVGFDAGAGQALDQGILTESGGDIRMFAHESVTLGTSRIFTLRGGNEIIWSSTGDIAAGTASKTVAAAPPTRVLIDPQSADLKTDLAGLATGGGIGVLATVEGVTPGDVDLIAPNGAIDAGDAGIRVSGNLNISATQVLNAENIQVTGASAGAPSSVAVAAPVVSVASPPPPLSQSTPSNPAQEARKREEEERDKAEEAMSIFTIEILGYGGGESASL